MFKLVVRYLEHTPVIGEQYNTAIVIFMLSLIYLKAPTLWVIQHRAETSGRSLPLNTQHITSALGSQVDQGRCFKNNPPFHPCQSLLFLFRHGSRKKKNTQTIKSQHQLNIKHGPGSMQCRMFHSQRLWLWLWEKLDGARSTTDW